MESLKRIKWSALFSTGVVMLLGSLWGSADLHLVKEESRIWNQGASRMQDVTEIWQVKDKKYTKRRNRITIIRKDLNKIWRLDLKNQTYTETSLESSGGMRMPLRRPPEKLHNQGYEYAPEYEWVMQDTGITEEIGGIKCRKYLLDGDADYSEKDVEIWAADDVGIDGEKYGDIRSYLSTMESRNYVRALDELKSRFILWERVVIDHHIILSMTNEMKVTCLEDADPPPGIYEIPEGFTKEESSVPGGRRQQ